MNFYDAMFLSPETKEALDRGLFRMYLLGPCLYYLTYKALMALANHTIKKYTDDEDE